MANGKLTVMKIKALTKVGAYGDGNGLYCQVSRTQTKSWLVRWMKDGKQRSMGLGSVASVSLADAREKARQVRQLLAAGIDPIAHRQAEQAAGMTFQEVATKYLASHAAAWRNDIHRQQWHSTLETYVFPKIGGLSVATLTTADVLSVLTPIWTEKPETSSRIRGRIEAILSYAKSHGWRTGENVATWKDNLENLLPSKSKVASVKHHAALPYADLPDFMADLGKRKGTSGDALAFLILTACRTGEALGATWAEIDLENKVWTIPAGRMKAGKEHRVPLSREAIAILHKVQPEKPDPTSHVFPGAKPHEPLSNMALTRVLVRMNQKAGVTVHGFRSTFRDWTAEMTDHGRDAGEAALAHTLATNGTEAAYLRATMFEKRKLLMDDWAEYAMSESEAEADSRT